MLNKNKSLETAEDLHGLLDEASLGAIRRRDLKSAVSRVCEMAGCAPPSLRLEVSILRETLRKIRPAAHGVSWKTWGNLQSLFRRPLELAGVIDRMDRGVALRHSLWGPLMRSIAHDKRLAGGLAAFANWCAAKDISPDQINDVVLQEFHVWLETRTLCPKPRDVVRRIPHVWNEARRTISGWPQLELTTLSFKCPQKHLRLTDLHESFQADVQSYLAMRADPDVFDERPNAPRRRLAKSTLQAQSEHLRLSASVLVESGVPSAEIKSLADLIRPERFKAILRHYHKQADGQPNAFANCLAQTLIQVAKHYAGVTPGELEQLKEIARKLPAVPLEPTAKNNALVRQLELERLRAKLLFLPDDLIAEVKREARLVQKPRCLACHPHGTRCSEAFHHFALHTVLASRGAVCQKAWPHYGPIQPRRPDDPLLHRLSGIEGVRGPPITWWALITIRSRARQVRMTMRAPWR